jgi:hypothetical protein
MTKQWGPHYGFAILRQQILESPHADVIADAISSKTNSVLDYQQNLADRLEEARVKRERFVKEKAAQKQRSKRKTSRPLPPGDDKSELKRDESAHTQAQSELVALGQLTGCAVWIPSNDQGGSTAEKT